MSKKERKWQRGIVAHPLSESQWNSSGAMWPPSFEWEQRRYEVEGWGWSAKERTLIARTKQFLERSHSVKVQVEEFEDLLGPDDVDVDFR